MTKPAKLYAWHSALTARLLGDGRREFVHVHCRHNVEKQTERRVYITCRCPHRTGILDESQKRKAWVVPAEAVTYRWWKIGGETWYIGTEEPHAIGGRLNGQADGVIPERPRMLWEEPEALIPGTSVLPTAACLTELGLDRKATAADVRRAYRREALRAHPDRGGSNEAFVKLGRTYQAALAAVGARQ